MSEIGYDTNDTGYERAPMRSSLAAPVSAEIPRGQEALDKHLANLRTAVDALQQRIGSVLRPSEPSPVDESALKAVERDRSDLAHWLQRVCDETSDLSRAVHRLIDRIDL